MTRPPALTPEQIDVVRRHLDLFPAEVLKLPEFLGAGITRDTIRNYQRRIKAEAEPNDDAELAAMIRIYIARHGLPSRFHGYHGVTGFLEYLDTRAAAHEE